MLELRKVVPGLGNSKARKEGFKENHEVGRFSSALRPKRHRLRKYSRDGFRLEMPEGDSPCRKNGETRGKLTTVPGVKTPKTFQKKRQKQGPQWLKGYRSLRILLGWRNAERKGGGLYRGELRTTTFSEELAWLLQMQGSSSEDRADPLRFGIYTNIWDSSHTEPKRA